MAKTTFSIEEAKQIGDKLEITWDSWGIEQFRMGLNIELEHGTISPSTNITNDDPILTGKIALAHLNEHSDYYTRLREMEDAAEAAEEAAASQNQ